MAPYKTPRHPVFLPSWREVVTATPSHRLGFGNAPLGLCSLNMPHLTHVFRLQRAARSMTLTKKTKRYGRDKDRATVVEATRFDKELSTLRPIPKLTPKEGVTVKSRWSGMMEARSTMRTKAISSDAIECTACLTYSLVHVLL